MSDDHDEMVQNWIDECADNGWDINGVPLNSDSKPSPWVEEAWLGSVPITTAEPTTAPMEKMMYGTD